MSSVEIMPGTLDYFTQTFYHACAFPLLMCTLLLAYAARPKVEDDLPPGFGKFAWNYLSVWSLCVGADWLQGPYVYELYRAYGFSTGEIAQLFVAGFGSSMVFGCIVGVVTDKFGRKRSSILYCAMYILSCLTKHVKSYSILMLGRVTGGIATSLLFSSFECWMVAEHQMRHNFSGPLLGYMFGMMFTVMYLVAIASGLIGQAVAGLGAFGPVAENSLIYTGGASAPFDVAILCLTIGTVLIVTNWEENYGDKEAGESASASGLCANLGDGFRLLCRDRRLALLGVIVSCFEGSMFAFVFYWTPVLSSPTTPAPLGLIFAMFMMSCMCGASTSTLLGGCLKPSYRLMTAFVTGLVAFAALSFSVNVGAQDHLKLSFAACLAFEFCVGMYFPSIGVLKSDIVPEQVRSTVYNMYRVPLNAIVVSLLLSNISMATCFKLNAMFLSVALAGILSITCQNDDVGIASLPAKRVVSDDEMSSLTKHPYDKVSMSQDSSIIGKRADRPACAVDEV